MSTKDTAARYTKTFPISWEQLHRDSKALSWRLVELGQWDKIVVLLGIEE